MKKTVYATFIMGSIVGCIDPIRINTTDTAGTLVVDAIFTNETGPQTVKLSRSITFDNSRPLRVFAVPEKNASVSISDGEITEHLVEKATGEFVTTTFTGVVGKSYSIQVKTIDGKVYSSLPEKMLPVAKVDSVKVIYNPRTRFFMNANGVGRTQTILGFDIAVVATDPKGFGNNYRWEATGIYEFFSGHPQEAFRTCWVSLPRLENTIVLSNDALFDGQKFKVPVCGILYDRPTKYMVKMKQSSLSEKAYNYWKVAYSQQTSTGSLFDPPPTIGQGNVISTDGERALGYFTVSSVQRLDYLFNRFVAANYAMPDPNEIPREGDCRFQIPGATNVRPEGF